LLKIIVSDYNQSMSKINGPESNTFVFDEDALSKLAISFPDAVGFMPPPQLGTHEETSTEQEAQRQFVDYEDERWGSGLKP
jgi:hypothetical protein